jgi:hypothetical protein
VLGFFFLVCGGISTAACMLCPRPSQDICFNARTALCYRDASIANGAMRSRIALGGILRCQEPARHIGNQRAAVWRRGGWAWWLSVTTPNHRDYSNLQLLLAYSSPRACQVSTPEPIQAASCSTNKTRSVDVLACNACLAGTFWVHCVGAAVGPVCSAQGRDVDCNNTYTAAWRVYKEMG